MATNENNNDKNQLSDETKSVQKRNSDANLIEYNAEGKPVQYSTIKRMLNTLDKFLSKKLVLVLGICILAISSCALGLFINNSNTSNAATGSGAKENSLNLTLNTWLWSLLALFAFIAVLSVIYTFAKRRSNLKTSKS